MLSGQRIQWKEDRDAFFSCSQLHALNSNSVSAAWGSLVDDGPAPVGENR